MLHGGYGMGKHQLCQPGIVARVATVDHVYPSLIRIAQPRDPTTGTKTFLSDRITEYDPLRSRDHAVSLSVNE